MCSHPALLLVGRDALLIETRSRVLERAGFLVKKALDVDSARDEIVSQPLHLLLLPHSLSVEGCHGVLYAAHTLSPGLRALVLRDGAASFDIDAEDVVMDEFLAPGILIAAVHELTAWSHPAV